MSETGMSSREQHTVNLGALAVTLYLVGAALTVIGIVWQYTSDGPGASSSGCAASASWSRG